MQPLQQVVQLPEDPLKGPGGRAERALRPRVPDGAPSIPPASPRHSHAHRAHVELVLAEAVDATDGDGLNVVTEEEAVVPLRVAGALLEHHQQQRLEGVQEGRQGVPVGALQLQAGEQGRPSAGQARSGGCPGAKGSWGKGGAPPLPP